MERRVGSGCAVASVLLVVLTGCDRREATTQMDDGGPVDVQSKSSTENDWQEFQIPDVGASVLMPVGSSTRQRKPVQQNYSSAKDGVAYIAFGPSSEYNVIVFTPVIPPGQTVDQALDAHVQRYVDQIPKGQVVEGVQMAGLPARGYVVMGVEKPAWEDRVVAIGNKWVVLRVNNPPADLTRNRKFFDSFQRTDGER